MTSKKSEMKCIIIDDDRLVREITESFVQKTAPLVLLHSLSSALDAMNVLNAGDNIDLIFLDIEMPEMTGIEFLNYSRHCRRSSLSRQKKSMLSTLSTTTLPTTS